MTTSRSRDEIILSIIVPVHNVATYVPDCLRSVLAHPSPHMEVLVVDDCSTDDSGAVLDEIAAGDHRVTVFHLDENVGQGWARNHAIDRARGAYLWPVDSDDWIAADAIDQILEHIENFRPEIIMLGHAIVHLDGSVETAASNAMLSGLPPVYSAADHPELYEAPSVPWNRVTNRQFYEHLGGRHPKGAYEDLPVVIPLLAAATRVTSIARPCVFWRRRSGSITNVQSDHHVDVIDQWALVLDTIHSSDRYAASLQPTIYNMAVAHVLSFLQSGRLPRATRRPFYDRAATVLPRRRRPGQPASRLESVRAGLLARGGYRLTLVAQAIHRAVTGARHLAPALGERVAAFASLVARAPRGVVFRVYYAAQRRRPLDPDLAVFSSYWSRNARCNPQAIAQALRDRRPTMRIVWIANPDDDIAPPGTIIAHAGTFAYYRTLARATYLVNNVNFGDDLVRRPGTMFIQTHHGTPLKTMGVDVPSTRAPARGHRAARAQSIRRSSAWDVCLSSNEHSSLTWKTAFAGDFEILDTGYPRNDVLVRNDPDERAAVRQALGLGPDELAVLYAPTFRDYDSTYWMNLDPVSLVDVAPAGTTLLLRSHRLQGIGEAAHHPNIRDVADHPSTEDLLLATDVLISDYSSITFDYALLDRPIVLYVPDLLLYQATRGTYFDITADPPGPVAYRPSELAAIFAERRYETPESDAARAAFRARFCHFDDGRAASRVVDFLLDGTREPLDHTGPPAGDRTRVS